MRKIVLFSMICGFIACSTGQENIPNDILSKEEMKNVLVDIHLLEATMNFERLEKDSLNSIMPGFYLRIFVKHDITKEDFQRSFDYYTMHRDQMNDIYEEVLDELEEMNEKR